MKAAWLLARSISSSRSPPAFPLLVVSSSEPPSRSSARSRSTRPKGSAEQEENLSKELWMYQPDFGLQKTKRGVFCWFPVELFRLFSSFQAVSCHLCYDICFFLSFFQYTRTCGRLHAYEKERSGWGSNLGQDTIEIGDSAWFFLFWGGAHEALVFSLVEFLVYSDIYDLNLPYLGIYPYTYTL